MNLRDELKERFPNISEDVLDRNTRAYLEGSTNNVEAMKKENKYHVSAREDRTYNGITYDSKKEADYAEELDFAVYAGRISFWLRQVPFILGYDPLTVYKADFMTFEREEPLPFQEKPSLLDGWIVKVIEIKPKSERAWAPGAKRKLNLFRKKYPDFPLEVL